MLPSNSKNILNVLIREDRATWISGVGDNNGCRLVINQSLQIFQVHFPGALRLESEVKGQVTLLKVKHPHQDEVKGQSAAFPIHEVLWPHLQSVVASLHTACVNEAAVDRNTRLWYQDVLAKVAQHRQAHLQSSTAGRCHHHILREIVEWGGRQERESCVSIYMSMLLTLTEPINSRSNLSDNLTIKQSI